MRTLFHTNKIDVLGILESKLDDKSLSYMMRIHFSDMSFSHNFFLSDKGRILVLWNPSSVSLNVVDLMINLCMCPSHAWLLRKFLWLLLFTVITQFFNVYLYRIH